MKKNPLLFFFILTFAITWGLGALFFLIPSQIIAIFGKASSYNPLFILAVWAPTISAVIATLATQGWSGVGELLMRFIRLRAGWQWYAFVLVCVPGLGLGVALLSRTYPLIPLNRWDLLAPLLVNLVITGPLGEELGWRGFALPRMLQRMSPLAASLVIGIIWGIWHLPAFFVSGTPQSGLSLPGFFLGALSLSCLATWLYRGTQDSVFFSFLLHLAANFVLSVFGAPLLQFSVALLLVVVVILLVSSRTWVRRAQAVEG